MTVARGRWTPPPEGAGLPSALGSAVGVAPAGGGWGEGVLPHQGSQSCGDGGPRARMWTACRGDRRERFGRRAALAAEPWQRPGSDHRFACLSGSHCV